MSAPLPAWLCLPSPHLSTLRVHAITTHAATGGLRTTDPEALPAKPWRGSIEYPVAMSFSRLFDGLSAPQSVSLPSCGEPEEKKIQHDG
ncbi:hypothetical protein V8C44DRAFT_327185 [Trichoderma aethiopicum]